MLRTDVDGTIEAKSDGATWEVVRRWVPAATVGGSLDLNKASIAELEALPGVGTVIAKRIVEGRPYHSVDDLRRVKGIGEKRLSELRHHVSTR